MAGGALGRSDDPMGVERVAFFSDAVFAIAITLLVIELTVPEGGMTGPQLTHELGRLGPKFFSFGLSFWVIGRFWISHHLTFQYLRRWNLPMLWINLLLLACIAFLPFPTAVHGVDPCPSADGDDAGLSGPRRWSVGWARDVKERSRVMSSGCMSSVDLPGYVNLFTTLRTISSNSPSSLSRLHLSEPDFAGRHHSDDKRLAGCRAYSWPALVGSTLTYRSRRRA